MLEIDRMLSPLRNRVRRSREREEGICCLPRRFFPRNRFALKMNFFEHRTFLSTCLLVGIMSLTKTHHYTPLF